MEQLNVVLNELNTLKNDIEGLRCVMADIDMQFVSKSCKDTRYPILTCQIFAERMQSRTTKIISDLQVYAQERLGEIMQSKVQEMH